jgi:hypothetical protein
VTPDDAGADERGEELVGETRLPDAGGTEHCQEMGCPFGRDAFPGFCQQSALALTTDNRRVEAPRERPSASNLAQPIDRQRRRFPLQLYRRQQLGIRGVADEAIGALAEQDFAAFRELLEPRRNVRRVTRDEIVVGDEADSRDRPSVDTSPGRDGDAEASFELRIEPSELRPHLDRRPHGPQGIVLVQGRDPEDREHGVADEFCERPAMALDDRPHRVEVLCHDLRERLRIELLPERGRADDVGEEDGDRLAERLRGLSQGHRPAAGVAETRPLTVLRATVRAGQHE